MPEQDPVVADYHRIYQELSKKYKDITSTDAALVLLAKAMGQLSGHISNLINWGDEKWTNPKVN